MWGVPGNVVSCTLVRTGAPLQLVEMLTSYVRPEASTGLQGSCRGMCETSRRSFISSIRHLPFWGTPGASPAALKAMLATTCNPSVSGNAFIVLRCCAVPNWYRRFAGTVALQLMVEFLKA
jgi:hypothetical protein